jgi:hypothetical protein
MKCFRVLYKLAAFLLCLVVLNLDSIAVAGSKIVGTTCEVFPDNGWWHADISQLPVHAQSGHWLSHMPEGVHLVPGFGPSPSNSSMPGGIPINVVNGTYPRTAVRFNNVDYSDAVTYPLGADTLIEGGGDRTTERRAIVVRSDNCQLYETWSTRFKDNEWLARIGVTWNLASNELRPKGRISADAAGFPILPGLLRYEETVSGNVDHAIRFTTNITDRSFLWPARRHAGSVSDPDYPPAGARFRLKADYSIASGLRSDTKAVLLALKRYGLALVGNGAAWSIQGTADARWPAEFLAELRQVPVSAFEAVDASSLMVAEDSMVVKPLVPDVLAEGDSISIFWGGNHTGTYAAATPGVRIKGVAVGGSQLRGPPGSNTLTARQAADLSHHARILTVFIGANDLGGYPSGRAYIDTLFAYLAPFREAGTKIAVATILARQVPTSPVYDARHNSNRIEANNLIRAAVGAEIDAVIDFAADPVMGTDSAPLDKTLFYDGLHPTNACAMGCGGQGRLAVIYKAALDDLLAQMND